MPHVFEEKKVSQLLHSNIIIKPRKTPMPLNPIKSY